MQMNLFDKTVYGYTVINGTWINQIPAHCQIRKAPDVPMIECKKCGLDNKVHWCDAEGNKYCTKDILEQKAFAFDVKKWVKF